MFLFKKLYQKKADKFECMASWLILGGVLPLAVALVTQHQQGLSYDSFFTPGSHSLSLGDRNGNRIAASKARQPCLAGDRCSWRDWLSRDGRVENSIRRCIRHRMAARCTGDHFYTIRQRHESGAG